MGVYPMLHDETSHFLAADFDGENWQQDACAFLDTCRRFGQSAHLILGFSQTPLTHSFSQAGE